MSTATVLLLVALVTAVDGPSVSLDKGLSAGLRLGDEGEIFYQLTIDNESKLIEAGRGRVVEADDTSSVLRLETGGLARPGYRVRFELPGERLTAELHRRAEAERETSRRLEELQRALAETTVRLERERSRAGALEKQLGAARAATAADLEPGPAAPGSVRLVVAENARPCLNVRRDASRQATPLDCVEPGVVLTLLEVDGDWRGVRLADGRAGWASAEYLRPEAESQVEMPTARAAELEAALVRARSEAASAVAEAVAANEMLRREAAAREAARQAEIDRLSREAAAAREELAARGERADERQVEANAEVARLRAELESASAAAADSDELRAKADSLRRELEQSRREAGGVEQELRGRLERVQAQSQDLERELAAAGGRNARLEAELTAMRSSLAEVEGELARLRDRGDEPLSQPAAAPAEAPEATAQETRALAVSGGAPSAPPPASGADRVAAEAEVAGAVRRWAAAWSGQRIEDYLSSYASDFRPATGVSRAAWEKQRRERLVAPSFIELEIEDLSIELADEGRARARFRQSYRSDTYSDEVSKVLELVRESGGWRIVAEVSG